MKEKTKYCEKHQLEYYAFLSRCPVCAGEEMAKDRIEITPKSKRLRRK